MTLCYKLQNLASVLLEAGGGPLIKTNLEI